MGSKWKQTTLGDLALGFDGAVDGPFGSNLPASAYTESGYPIIRGSNLSIGLDDFKDSDFVFVPEHIFQKLSRSECRAGDIIFTKKGTLGQTGLISARHRFEKYLLSSNQMRLRVDPEKALPEYVYYYVSSQKAINKLIQDSECTGVPKINLAYLKSFPISLPSLSGQKEIIYILGSLNRKIILNRQINQTLEQMSQTLFKSWFVDFDPVIDNALDAGNPIPETLQSRSALRQKVRNSADFKPLPADIRTLFPAEFEETELGWVPRDWYYVPLKNLGKIICGKTPDKSNKEYYGKDYLFIKIPDMHGKVFVTNSTDKLSTLGSETQIKKLIPKGSICVSCIATVGIVAINSKDCHTNQQINSIVPNSSILRNYLYFSMLEKNKTFHDLASGGSATLNMNTGIFSNVLTLKPEDSVLERFQQTSEHWFGRILANENEIHTLTALRDTLLPKLISGELSLEDLPDLVTQTEPA
ncbi:restriction endonuclease subunit S [Klebsiella michiganensis]|uniref:restriction endonuclease subunit S n=1 Tax=Klebsiella michiganensis TaxID=1134687 RepID=UPI00190C36F0|nr:restriction endonuclease subunit S [Klebsiella michiganensis]QQO69827.1 restriction endonuclease subunit S [Klebsiella michiganensis]